MCQLVPAAVLTCPHEAYVCTRHLRNQDHQSPSTAVASLHDIDSHDLLAHLCAAKETTVDVYNE